MHYKGVHVGKVIETVDDLIEHSYPHLGVAGKSQPSQVAAPAAAAPAPAAAAPDPEPEPMAEESHESEVEADPFASSDPSAPAPELSRTSKKSRR